VPDQSDANLTAYVEREYLMRGIGSVYVYGSDTEEIVAVDRGVSWATRILARWPADPAAFSGTVVVDVSHRKWARASCGGWLAGTSSVKTAATFS
jgi:Alpha/beta hydrolase domain